MKSDDFLRVNGPSEFFLMIANISPKSFRVYSIRKNPNSTLCWSYDVTRSIRTICKLQYCENKNAIISDSKKIRDAITANLSSKYHIEVL